MYAMPDMVLGFSREEVMVLETILVVMDAEEALQFFKELLKPRVRAKGSKDLDMAKPTGIMT